MERIIKVTISKDGKVATSPEVNRGDTVIWSFEGDVAAQKLEVRPKIPSSLFNASPKSNEIRGTIFPNPPGGDIFEYDIFKNGKELEWADGSNGGCFKPIGG